MRIVAFVFLVSVGLASGCNGSASPTDGIDGSSEGSDAGGDGGQVPTELVPVEVSGRVLAFETGTPITAPITVSTAGLTPAPTVTTSGADFTLTGVLPNSVFSILAGSPPDYRTTYDTAPPVGSDSITGVDVSVVAEATLSAFATAFAVTPTAGKATVLVQLVDGNGAGLAGVPSTAIQLDGAAPPVAVKFLGADKAPLPAVSATSASGWVVLYDVPVGLATITTPSSSGYVLDAPATATAGGLVSIVRVKATKGMAPKVPTNVSFTNQVVPIFSKRGCTVCHSGNGPGKDLGGLTLNGASMKIYSELTVEISPNFATKRVNLADPAKSLVLTMPSAESPPDAHPTVVFPNAVDPDYLTLLGWIMEGARP